MSVPNLRIGWRARRTSAISLTAGSPSTTPFAQAPRSIDNVQKCHSPRFICIGLHFDELTDGLMGTLSQSKREGQEASVSAKPYIGPVRLPESSFGGAQFPGCDNHISSPSGDVPFFVSSSVLPRPSFVKGSSDTASIWLGFLAQAIA